MRERERERGNNVDEDAMEVASLYYALWLNYLCIHKARLHRKWSQVHCRHFELKDQKDGGHL